MLKEVAGDILLTKAEALAHGVAPNDNFANGLALALRERWPAMIKPYGNHMVNASTGGLNVRLSPLNFGLLSNTASFTLFFFTRN